MLRNMSDQTITIKNWCVVVDVLRPDTNFGVTGQRRLECVRLVVSKDVEVPDRTTSRLVAVECTGQADLASVFIDDERPVVSKLASQAVADVRVTINVRIGCTHLHYTPTELKNYITYYGKYDEK